MLYLQKMITREPARKQGEMLLFEETDLNYVVQAPNIKFEIVNIEQH